MSGYKIWVGADRCGGYRIGAVENANDNHICPSNEQIYPSQMRHRCVAQDGWSYIVCTPTEAKERDLTIVNYFPRADGSRSSR